jgi:hypothetical protein
MSHLNLWDELHSYLDDDERIVFPEMYLENREIYDSIRDVVYLVKGRNGEPSADNRFPLDWVPEHYLPRLLKEQDVDILSKHLIVRLRLPWEKVSHEWLISQEELDENREYYDIIDIFLRVKHKDMDSTTFVFDRLEFEQNRDNYEIIDAKYLVSLKLTKETRARLLGIDPDSIHTYMSE